MSSRELKQRARALTSDRLRRAPQAILRRTSRLAHGLSPLTDEIAPRPAEPPLHVWLRRGTRRRLVISVAGVGSGPDARIQPAMAETLRRVGNDTVLFLADASRSWLNAPGLAEQMVATIEAEAARLRPREIVVVGNSLGATSALHLARLTRIDRVVAFGPRFSVDPDVVAIEDRFFARRGLERPLRFRDLAELPPEGCRSTILLGGNERELAHARHFETGANQRVLILPGLDHHVPEHLRARSLLVGAIRAGLAGREAQLDRTLAPLGATERDLFFSKPTHPPAEEAFDHDRV